MPYASVESTRAVEVVAVPPPIPWWETPVFGIPLWMLLLGGGVAAVGIGAAAYIAEEQRRRMLMMALAR